LGGKPVLSEETMNKSLILITGGNSGIGKAAAIKLASQGAKVIIGCRNADRGKEALSNIRKESGSENVSMLLIDLSSNKSIQTASDEFRKTNDHLDCLIHNAADFDISRKTPEYSEDGIEKIWATNHLGPVRLTKHLEKELERSGQGRIITIASKGLIAHPFLKVRLDDPEFKQGGFSVEKAYYQSKLAQIMYTYWLAEKYQNKSITANCIRVTNVQIDISRYPNLSSIAKKLYAMKSKYSITPHQMAEVYVWLATSTEALKHSGDYFDEKCQKVSSGKYSKDPEKINELMKITEKYVPALLS
jgi:NAD(P)-dependent dehydrogenase (short-subunit alcohol dehydrogenase family)